MISMNRPETESRPYEFLLHSPFLMLLVSITSIIYCDILDPSPPATHMRERYQPLGYKFIIHCKIQGPQSRTIKETLTVVNIVFHQSPFTQDKTEVRKGMYPFDIAFTWFFMSSKVVDTLPDKSGVYTQHSTLIIAQVPP